MSRSNPPHHRQGHGPIETVIPAILLLEFPLPGIASASVEKRTSPGRLYSGDEGIERDASVLFIEGFERGIFEVIEYLSVHVAVFVHVDCAFGGVGD